jgi:hypothetical protein
LVGHGGGGRAEEDASRILGSDEVPNFKLTGATYVSSCHLSRV